VARSLVATNVRPENGGPGPVIAANDHFPPFASTRAFGDIIRFT
jgi:hypothetical protein